jgi:SAM-dependent methyltransferase
MPEISWNLAYWGGEYDWKTGGEEWSEAWGGSEPQWFGSLFPRIHRAFPAAAVLEIAPGFGRWTKFLIPACNRFTGIDLSGECVAACRETFCDACGAQFEQNDGLSLEAAPDGIYDLVFSFDSLVHAEADVFDAYVPQILRKLTPGGVAFIHHSNLAALSPDVENPYARARSVSGETVAAAVDRAGGKTLVQERVTWGSAPLSDCFTLFARKEHPDKKPARQITNARFMEEAALIRDTQSLWTKSALISADSRPRPNVANTVVDSLR